MSTFYIKNNQVIDETIYLTGEDVNHIKNVLRYKVGDSITVCDENETRYNTKITAFENNEVILSIVEKESETTEAGVNIDLYQGLPKFDKMELIIQKGTEIGVKRFIPVISDRVIVKLDDKNEVKKLDRWKKIAKEAAMQSGRGLIPAVENTTNLKNIIENLSKYDIVIMPYECEKELYLKDVLRNNLNKPKNVAVVIGPEGGFSKNDINLLSTLGNLKIVTLGKRILRTETAGLVTISNIIYEFDS